MIQPRNINSKTLRQYLTKLGSRTQLTERIQAYKQWNHKISKLHPVNSIRPFFDKNTRFESTDKTVTKSEEALATSTTAAPSHNTDGNKISTTTIPRKQPTTELNLPRLLRAYRDLSKAKLATLVILTTMCGYAMAPMATNVTCLFATTAGTGLCVASANAINQWLEIPYDAQMARTRNRVLVRNVITPTHALYFGIVTGITGTGILSTMVNPLTALLGASNILLYTCVYTPMKRVTIANTWVGSIVGAIPPMMGWAACTNNLESGAWVLGATLLAWQFPHFNALAWSM
ncbi:15578_t:CDS:1, partial [Acaulospora morrowiae]